MKKKYCKVPMWDSGDRIACGEPAIIEHAGVSLCKKHVKERLEKLDEQESLILNLYMKTKQVNEMINLKGRAYRLIMKIAHKYNWHYAPPIHPEGDTVLWCKWCGFRQTIKEKNFSGLKIERKNNE